MRLILVLLKAALFVLLLGFAFKNTDGVTVRYFLGFEWQAPLVFVLLVVMVLGAGLGVMASLSVIVRQRREILKLRRELRARAQPAADPPVVATAESL